MILDYEKQGRTQKVQKMLDATTQLRVQAARANSKKTVPLMGFEEVTPNEAVESKNIVCHRSQ